MGMRPFDEDIRKLQDRHERLAKTRWVTYN